MLIELYCAEELNSKDEALTDTCSNGQVPKEFLAPGWEKWRINYVLAVDGYQWTRPAARTTQ
jgi:hypothetical protein